MKILICGGHLTPAIAMIEYIQQTHPTDTLVFVGTGFTQKSNHQISQEKKEVTEHQVPFMSLSAVKLSELKSFWLILEIGKLIRSIIKALRILMTQRPQVVLAFGGYVAIPVSIAAWFLKIPVITHEQTYATGMGNQIIAHFSKKVAISHPESKRYFPQSKVIFTGNPVRSQLFKINHQKPDWFTAPQSETFPLLYITGGNQGSQIINDTISQILPQLTSKWTVLHQCGNPTASSNYEKTLQTLKHQLSLVKQHRYLIRPWISVAELAWIYSHAAVIISRAGANTVDEITAFKIPSILIPLPFAHRNEQLLNAQALSKKKLAIIVHQKNLNPDIILKKTNYLRNNFEQIKKKFADTTENNLKAPQKLYEILQTVTT